MRTSHSMPAPNLVGEKKKTRTNAIVLYSFGAIIAALILLFVGYVLYFMWQFRFGDPNTLQELERSLRPSQFTQIDARSLSSVYIEDYEKYIHPHNPSVGPNDAPITLIAFIDFECPFCQRSYPITKEITQQFSGAIRFVFKHLPLSAIHPQALDAAVASSCAHKQNAFWPYYDQLFTQKNLDTDSLLSMAQQSGLEKNSFSACLSQNPFIQDIQQDAADAIEIGVRGTPTYILNGQVLEGVISKKQWKELILSQLRQ